MNTGVEILLQRMKDCPEDFYPEYSKPMTRWSRLVDHAVGDELLTEEEHDALMAGLKEVRRTRFTEMVMKELAGEGEVSDEGKTRSSTNAQSVMGLGGAIQGLSSIQNQAYNNLTLGTNGTGQLAWQPNTATLTLGQTQLQEEQVKHMIAHLDKLKREEQLKVKEKPKTLFGKLFNYT